MHLSLNDDLSFRTFSFRYWVVFLSECSHVLENQRVEQASDQNAAYKSFELTFGVHFFLSFLLSLSVYLSFHCVRWVQFNGFLMLRCMKSERRKEWRVRASEKARRQICLINSAGKVITRNESTETIPDELLRVSLFVCFLTLGHSCYAAHTVLSLYCILPNVG